MSSFLLRRLLQGIATLWVVITISFALMRVAPGGPFDKEKPLAPAVIANLKRNFGLARDIAVNQPATIQQFFVHSGQSVSRNSLIAKLQSDGRTIDFVADADLVVTQTVGEPGRQLKAGDVLLVVETSLFDQYIATLFSYLRFDFGVTYASEGSKTVASIISKSFPVSLEMGLFALLFAVVVGVSIGMLAALKRNTWMDYLSMSAALAAVSASSIVVGPMLILFFGIYLKWLPWGGWTVLAFDWTHMQVKILPTLTLGLVYAAWFARLTRAGAIEVFSQDYIRTARAKGLSEWRVVTHHALRGSVLPAVSFLGPALAGIVTGSVVVERVFAVPGIGENFVTSAINRDYPLVLGTVVLYSTLLILANLAVDVAYAWLDPRVRRP